MIVHTLETVQSEYRMTTTYVSAIKANIYLNNKACYVITVPWEVYSWKRVKGCECPLNVALRSSITHCTERCTKGKL